MCHAILRIAYHHDKAKDMVEIELAEEFTKRLEEVRNRPGVRKVTIFYPHMSYEEVKKWETTMHTQEKVNEQTDEDYVAPGIKEYQEVSSYNGSEDEAFPTIC